MRRAPLTRSSARATRARSTYQSLIPLAAAVLAAVVYVNALDNPFVYDDRDTVTANPSLADPSNVTFLLVYSPFRPLVNVSYALDRVAWGVEPFGFHVTNLALHALTTALLAMLFLRLLSDVGLTCWSGAAAFIGASMFALHPLQTEAVGYISGRSELMCAVPFLAALLAARSAIVSSRMWRGVAAVVFGAAALASKETAIVLPALVLAYDRLLRPGTDAARRWRLVYVHLPVLMLLMGAGLVRLLAFAPVPPAGVSSGPLLNLLTQSIVVWRYLGLLAWPHGQSIMHSVHRVASAFDPVALVAAAGLAAVCVAAISVKRARPLLAFGTLWFLAVLAPSSSVIALREGMAEHRVYLASAGIFLIVAEQAALWFPAGLVTARHRASALVTVCGVLAILGALTVRRNAVWSSPVSLWMEATVHAGGMWEPHYALGDALRDQGDCSRAIAAYRSAVQRQPAHRDAQTNLGICLAQTGELEEAERAFGRALEIDPGFARGYTNLGALALTAGDPVRARDFYNEALARDNSNVLARMQLASLFEHTFQDHHSAARMCGEARLIAPGTPGVAECVERNQRLAAAADRAR